MDRQAAYQRKLAVIVDELESLPSGDADLSGLELRGVLHAVQVAVDAAMDVAAMRVKDIGKEPVDDYHNLDTLVESDGLGAGLADELRRLNGLRNAIVHKYNRFEEQTVLEGIEQIRSTLYGFVEHMEGRA